MKDKIEEEYEDGIIVKPLGEVCEINQGNSLTKTDMIEGIYDVIGGGKIIGKHNQKNRDGNDFTLTRVGDININFIDKPYYLTDNGFSLKSRQEDIMTKYLYYLLSHNKNYLTNLYQGTAQKVISKTNLKSIKIPVPKLDKQQEIVKYLDFIYEKANKTSNNKIVELKELNKFCLNNQKIFGKNIVKKLGDVFKEVKTGKDIVATDRKKGEYPFYGANGIIDYVNNYIFDGKYLLTARTGSLGSLHISNGKCWCSGDVHRMEFENDTLLSYTYYYLQTIDFQKFRTGSVYPKLSGSSLKSIKIHIPSPERQKEIVEYCEYNDTLIKQLEKEIENNEKQALQFITDIIKLKNQVEEQNDINLVNIQPIDKVQNEIISVEEIDIKPKSKIKKVVKIKPPLIVIEDNKI
jgi:type I restriction enzyme S subunit